MSEEPVGYRNHGEVDIHVYKGGTLQGFVAIKPKTSAARFVLREMGKSIKFQSGRYGPCVPWGFDAEIWLLTAFDAGMHSYWTSSYWDQFQAALNGCKEYLESCSKNAA